MDNKILKNKSNDSFQFRNFQDSFKEYNLKETNIKEVVFDKIVGNLKTECQTIFPAYVEDTMDPYNEEEYAEVLKHSCKIVTPFNKSINNHKKCSTTNFKVSESNLQNHEQTNLSCDTKNMNTSFHLSESHISKPPPTFSKMTHNCSKFCVWCQQSFAVFDNPNHIGRIRNIEKQNAFFKIEESLKIDSCLCDRCWKFLEKTYKSKLEKKIKEVEVISVSNNVIKIETEAADDIVMKALVKKSSNVVKRNKRSKRSRKRNFQPDICSVYNCSQYSVHPIPIDECVLLKHIFSMFDFSSIIFVESKIKIKQSVSSSLSVCEEHLHLVNVVTTCQLCGNKLNGNLDSEIWKMYDKYNWRLLCNNIPLMLKPGMFLCDTCESYISEKDSSLKVNFENMRQNVENRYNARIKLFGPPLNLSSENSQDSNVDPPLVIANIVKQENNTKVKFTDPLITKTHYYEPDKKGNYSRNERQNCSSINLDLFANPEVLSNENSKSLSSLTDLSVLYNDKLPQTATEKYTNQIKLEPRNEEFDDLEMSTSVLDTEKEIAVSLSRRKSGNLPQNPTQCRVINETESVDNCSVIMPYNKLSVSSVHYKEQYSAANLTKNIVLNDTFNHSTNVQFSSNENAITANMDVDKDLLPLHVLNLLDNDENKMPGSIETDKNEQVITSIDSPLSVSSLKKVETNESKFVNTCVGSDQKESKVKGVETCKNKLVKTDLSHSCVSRIDPCGPIITEVYSQPSEALKISQDKRSTDLNEDNQNINVGNELNVKTVYLNESSLASLYSSLPVEESLRVKADSVEIRKKLRNVVYQRISHGGMKKQRLNKHLELDEISLHDGENETDSSFKNMSTEYDGAESYRDENIIYHRPNLPSIVNTYTHNTNENILFSDYSNDVQYYVSSDEDESCKPNDNSLVENTSTEELNTYNETCMPNNNHFTEYTSDEFNTYVPKENHSMEYASTEEINACKETCMSKDNYFKKNVSTKELNSNEPLIHIDKIYSLDPTFAPSIQFHRTLKKVPEFYNKMSFNRDERNCDNITSDSDNLSDDSQELETIYQNNKEQLKSNPMSENKSFSRNIESSQLTTDETNDSVQYISNQCDEQDDTEDIHFQLNNSNNLIYESLKERFNDSELIMYLLENQRMLLNQELVLSNNASPYVSNYIQKYMKLLHSWYGDPNACNASKSYLPSSSYVKQYSSRFSPDRELPVVTRGINSITPSKSNRTYIPALNPKEIVTSSDDAYQVQNNVSTNTTYTLSTPITSKQVFNFSSAAQQTGTTVNPPVNLQTPVVHRLSSIRQSKPTCYRSVPQPSFQLPTAVRSGGTPFDQKSHFRHIRPNLSTHLGIRNPFNNNYVL